MTVGTPFFSKHFLYIFMILLSAHCSFMSPGAFSISHFLDLTTIPHLKYFGVSVHSPGLTSLPIPSFLYNICIPKIPSIVTLDHPPFSFLNSRPMNLTSIFFFLTLPLRCLKGILKLRYVKLIIPGSNMLLIIILHFHERWVFSHLYALA